MSSCFFRGSDERISRRSLLLWVPGAPSFPPLEGWGGCRCLRFYCHPERSEGPASIAVAVAGAVAFRCSGCPIFPASGRVGSWPWRLAHVHLVIPAHRRDTFAPDSIDSPTIKCQNQTKQSHGTITTAGRRSVPARRAQFASNANHSTSWPN